MKTALAKQMSSESTAKTRDKDRRREGIRMMVPKAARVLT